MTKETSIHKSASPDGRWVLTIRGPIKESPYPYAEFSSKLGHQSFPFGYDISSDLLTVEWQLPDNVCAIYVDAKCYALFRWGAKRRRKREYYRTGKDNYFSDAEIEDVCSKRHIQVKRQP